MVLKERVVRQPLDYCPLDKKQVQEHRTSQVLEKIHSQTLQGTITQMSVFTEHAHGVFSELFELATDTFKRSNELSERVARLTEFVNNRPIELLAGDRYKRNNAMDAHMKTSHFLFSPSAAPEIMNKVYSQAGDMPDFDEYDKLVGTKANSRLQYSNPNYFNERFVEAERKRQEAAAGRKKKRREERRAQKAKKGDKKKTEVDVEKKQRLQVEAIQKKTYNVHGAEFADDNLLHSPDGDTRRTTVQELRISRISASLVAVIQPPVDFPPPPTPTHVFSKTATLDFQSNDFVDSPYEEVKQFNLTIPSPGVPAPPPPKSVPARSPARSPAPSGGLFDGIREGISLKKTEQVQRLPVSENPLLAQIRSGAHLRLKKVEITEQLPKADNEDGTLNEIMKLLNRRKYIQDSDSDSDNWSDED